MQLIVKIELAEPLTLPINYNHIQQATIYNLMSGAEGISDFAHNQGYQYENRTFRMFCFSPLKGNYSVNDKKITFTENVTFEIRSQSNIFILKMWDSLKQSRIRLGNAEIGHVDTEITDKTIRNNCIEICTKAPITVFSSDEDGSKIFKSPDDEDFYGLIADNFIRKYTAFYGAYPESDIKIDGTMGMDYRKMVTYFHRAPIVGWSGRFVLQGDPGYINFLYNTGLGSKNAQGFGMFDVYEK